jgi:hypothetical protein
MSGLVAVTVWLRFSSLRLLTWNHNYNVKPREISAALDRLGANLIQVSEASWAAWGVGVYACQDWREVWASLAGSQWRSRRTGGGSDVRAGGCDCVAALQQLEASDLEPQLQRQA